MLLCAFTSFALFSMFLVSFLYPTIGFIHFGWQGFVSLIVSSVFLTWSITVLLLLLSSLWSCRICGFCVLVILVHSCIFNNCFVFSCVLILCTLSRFCVIFDLWSLFSLLLVPLLYLTIIFIHFGWQGFVCPMSGRLFNCFYRLSSLIAWFVLFTWCMTVLLFLLFSLWSCRTSVCGFWVLDFVSSCPLMLCALFRSCGIFDIFSFLFRLNFIHLAIIFSW